MIASFDADSIRGYAHSSEGIRRSQLADALNLPEEEVDRWSKRRVDYNIIRQNARLEHEQEQREEKRLEQQKPDRFPLDLWKRAPEKVRQKIKQGEMKPSVRSLEHLVEQVEEKRERYEETDD